MATSSSSSGTTLSTTAVPATAASSSTNAMLFENRLRSLELRLGLLSMSSSSSSSLPSLHTTTTTGSGGNIKKNSSSASLTSSPATAAATTTTTTSSSSTQAYRLEERLKAMEDRYATLTPSTLRQLWDEAEALTHLLHPATALTHQQQIVAPILYRKQEVLAAADDLRAQLLLCHAILQHLVILPSSSSSSRTSLSGGSTSTATSMMLPLTEDQVLSASLLSTTAAPVRFTETERLLQLAETVADLQHRLHVASAQLDHGLQAYQDLVLAASEKCVLANELVAWHEATAAAKGSS